MRRVLGPRELTNEEHEHWLAWLAEGVEGGGFCGFDRDGWEASRWILNSIFEDPSASDGVTHDDRHRGRAQTGLEHPIEKILDDAGAIVVGSALGMGLPRSPNTRRLLWSELAQRLGIDFAGQTVPPCLRWFPYRSWPVGIRPPDEGSLDRESLKTLVSWLADQSHDGAGTTCVGYFTPMIRANFDRPLMYQFRLDELESLATKMAVKATPSNWWPLDRSWFVYTDWDLWGTKFSGDASLVASLERSTDLETIIWP